MFLYSLTCKCAWRHGGGPFFDHFLTSARQKMDRTPHVFNILTCKCASRYSGVQIFHSPTSKDARTLRCFVHFDLQMCFAPQRRAIFRHRSFQKWSRTVSFLAFWLANVLRATAACNVSRSKLRKVVRSWGVLYILIWKCASCHSGVPIFLSALSSYLRTRRFSEPTFRPSRRTNPRKNTAFTRLP